jgi:uncharacterized protein YjbI with pentapeptide repeats
MADEEHLELLKQGAIAWNAWREENTDNTPDLSRADLTSEEFHPLSLYGADLSDADLEGANLSGLELVEAHFGHANLSRANLSLTECHTAKLYEAILTGANLTEASFVRANFYKADLSGAYLAQTDFHNADFNEAVLSGANLTEADLRDTDFTEAVLRGADLTKANLSGADLRGANLRGVDLRGADLSNTNLVGADLTNADLTGCRIHGVNAWRLKLEGTKQSNLIITDYDEPEITVDNIEVAQFIYLLLRNEKIRDVIDTVTSKAVLILGRFTDERKAVLDAMRDELRKRDYLPILFDFEKPASRDITETVSLLARMSRFVLADITDARSIPQELSLIVPDLPSVPVQPLLLSGSGEYGMFEHFRRYPWVLPIHHYDTQEQLIADLGEHVIRPVEIKVEELRGPPQEPSGGLGGTLT